MEERKMRLRGGMLMNNLLANIKGKVEHECGSEEGKHVGSGMWRTAWENTTRIKRSPYSDYCPMSQWRGADVRATGATQQQLHSACFSILIYFCIFCHLTKEDEENTSAVKTRKAPGKGTARERKSPGKPRCSFCAHGGGSPLFSAAARLHTACTDYHAFMVHSVPPSLCSFAGFHKRRK